MFLRTKHGDLLVGRELLELVPGQFRVDRLRGADTDATVALAAVGHSAVLAVSWRDAMVKRNTNADRDSRMKRGSGQEVGKSGRSQPRDTGSEQASMESKDVELKPRAPSTRTSENPPGDAGPSDWLHQVPASWAAPLIALMWTAALSAVGCVLGGVALVVVALRTSNPVPAVFGGALVGQPLKWLIRALREWLGRPPKD